ncbi:amidase [Sphingopyxis sp.]|jgi:Asp-tRNA(Asn)/Glu-tRNA(Gln) amidotransferase A subunit family amidase|uniref:amidase n=1 Tax=Sphingopyxis sp. TaxID=1908224 RepID=UPI002DE68074|nr:amidase [Sphingopyxis sp.]
MSAFAEYASYDGVGLAELVQKKEVQPIELVEAAIARTTSENAKLNFLANPMFEQARKSAAKADIDGGFAGVPFALKDLSLHCKGGRLTNGSRLYRGYVSDHDSELASRYRQAGLIFVARTTSPEFGLTTTTESQLFGPTLNPWDSSLTPGGSSGGSAAAVAAGAVPLASAGDGGGSIRIPASCCGLFGLKTTRGRVPAGPAHGEIANGLGSHHVVSRSVRDSARALDLTCAPETGAPYTAPRSGGSYEEAASKDPRRLRIGVQRVAFNGANVHVDCLSATEDAAALCASLGHDVEYVDVSVDHQKLQRVIATLFGTLVIANVRGREAELGREARDDEIERATREYFDMASSFSALDYLLALEDMHLLGRRFATSFEDFDILLSPTMPQPPKKIGDLSLSHPEMSEHFAHLAETVGFTQIYNAAGSPAMSVPLYWNDAGIPIGVQFGARFGDEAALFGLAGQLERARPWLGRVPPGAS